MTIEILTTVLGWSSVINIAMLALTSLLLISMRSRIARIHSRLFGIEDRQLPAIYVGYLGTYKLMILVFNVVPYFALTIIQ